MARTAVVNVNWKEYGLETAITLDAPDPTPQRTKLSIDSISGLASQQDAPNCWEFEAGILEEYPDYDIKGLLLDIFNQSTLFKLTLSDDIGTTEEEFVEQYQNGQLSIKMGDLLMDESWENPGWQVVVSGSSLYLQMTSQIERYDSVYGLVKVEDTNGVKAEAGLVSMGQEIEYVLYYTFSPDMSDFLEHASAMYKGFYEIAFDLSSISSLPWYSQFRIYLDIEKYITLKSDGWTKDEELSSSLSLFYIFHEYVSSTSSLKSFSLVYTYNGHSTTGQSINYWPTFKVYSIEDLIAGQYARAIRVKEDKKTTNTSFYLSSSSYKWAEMTAYNSTPSTVYTISSYSHNSTYPYVAIVIPSQYCSGKSVAHALLNDDSIGWFYIRGSSSGTFTRYNKQTYKSDSGYSINKISSTFPYGTAYLFLGCGATQTAVTGWSGGTASEIKANFVMGLNNGDTIYGFQFDMTDTTAMVDTWDGNTPTIIEH